MATTYDLFISHASGDTEKYISPLTIALTTRKISFWLDSVKVGWGDNLSLMLSEGLRTSRFILLCLSRNFVQRPWTETELGAALAIQNRRGIKRVLPLILNAKDQVFFRYPILEGLVYREFREGVGKLADELAELLAKPDYKENLLKATIESGHTGRSFQISAEPKASIRWLVDRAQAALGLSSQAETGGYLPFFVRWVLVDARAEAIWRDLDRDEQRRLYSLIRTDFGLRFCYSDLDLLVNLDVYDGVVFHLYAIEDPEMEPPCAKYGH